MDRWVFLLYNQAMSTEPIFRGHQWNAPEGCGIYLIASADATRIPHGARGVFRQVCWVLDYAFDHGCLVKVGSARNAWERRSPNIAHLYMPETPYWEDTRASEAATHSAFICFHLDNHEVLSPITDNPKRYSRVLDPERILVARMLRIVDVGMNEGDAAYFDAQAALCEIINLLLHAKRIDEFTVEVRGHYQAKNLSDLAIAVRTFLRHNVARTVKLEDIADHVGVSISTLTHSYKNETGETPMETHQNLRINQIRSLLLKGEPPKVIAHLLGFSDVYHFSKYFKRVQGVSPKRYLANSKSATAAEPSD